jgi:hypothetical protein
MRSMRRRDFLAAAGALAAAGCTTGQPTRTPAASATRTSPATPPEPPSQAAAPQRPQPTPGTPEEMLARDTVPVLCYH